MSRFRVPYVQTDPFGYGSKWLDCKTECWKQKLKMSNIWPLKDVIGTLLWFVEMGLLTVSPLERHQIELTTSMVAVGAVLMEEDPWFGTLHILYMQHYAIIYIYIIYIYIYINEWEHETCYITFTFYGSVSDEPILWARPQMSKNLSTNYAKTFF